MSVLLEASVPTSDFLFQSVLANYRSSTIRLEPSVSINTKLLPYVWVTDVPPDRLEGLLSSEPHLKDAKVVDTTNGGLLVRLTWEDDGETNPLLGVLRERPVTVLEARGAESGWCFSFRFQTADAVSEFYRRCRNAGITVNPLKIQQNTSQMDGGMNEYGLTPTQRETLVESYELGYFKIPREISLVELADRYGISSNAVSERLRRGVNALIGGTLANPEEVTWSERDVKPRIEND